MRVIDLFAGCGGLSLGFQKAGFDVVAAFENWKPAIKVYQVNFKHPIFDLDLSKVKNHSIFTELTPDIIIGGPPCQDFSSAGKRNEDNGRGNLTVSFAEIVCNVKPQWFVMENVERIITSQKLKKVKKMFYDAGYGLSESILDASYCGVPQTRKRYFLAGLLNADEQFLESYIEKNKRQKPMTVFDYLGNTLGIEYYYRHPRSYARRGIFSIYEPSPTIRGVNRPIPITYVKHEGDVVDDLSKVRPLTTQERSYVQTFSDDFVWLGSKTEKEQLIGNAVPVQLAKFIANCIREYISTDKKHTHKKMLFEKFT
ncbi:MAG: DNA cytosine methyltransferase [Planctomycetaceae bacterium]|jgi:DNA (cytosine-5)-methyltransferase 1|nr:DNA cytosine methyltransferase [Planctomycetaceae bacterium]